MSNQQPAAALHAAVEQRREAIIRFLREICAIPSMDSQIGPVGERVADEMRQLGFDEVRFDKMGNILGRVGHGPTVIVYDSHIDTVGVGDPSAWRWDPFEGKVEDGVLYARGACDEKGSTPGMIYGIALGRDLGLIDPDQYTMYYFGNMEEWCDGIAPNSFAEVDPGVRPDLVVIGEFERPPPGQHGIAQGMVSMSMGDEEMRDFSGRDAGGIELLENRRPAIDEDGRSPGADEIGAIGGAVAWQR